MNPSPLADLDDLYLYAQLVSDDADEAAALMEAALDARRRGDRSAPDVLISTLSGHLTADGGAWLSRRQVPVALEELLPRMMGRIRPSRRMSVVRAFRDPGAPASDRAVFLIAVKRALESEGLKTVADRLTQDALEESMRRYLNTQMAPVPDSIRDVWERTFLPEDRRPTEPKNRFPLPARIAAGVLVILLSAAIGSWITSPSVETPTPRAELFDTLSDQRVEDPEFRASDSEQAERFLNDRLDWRLAVPALEDGILEGVSIAEMEGGLRFPVLHFEDQASDDAVNVFVLDYRFLESARSSFLVDDRILEQIAETGGVDIRNAPDYYRVVWRYRDDIYVAISDVVDADLRSRFLFE